MKWIPLNLPGPREGKKYDICLNDGTVINGVEFWDYGGGFDPLGPGETSPYGTAYNVKYPSSAVKAFKEHGG